MEKVQGMKAVVISIVPQEPRKMMHFNRFGDTKGSLIMIINNERLPDFISDIQLNDSLIITFCRLKMGRMLHSMRDQKLNSGIIQRCGRLNL